ncbi:MAG: hypothetical protein KDA68_07660 [Planctomycetaceae bacterium]|nr:hypothetical protein [Planctomycetaceae bacterium]
MIFKHPPAQHQKTRRKVVLLSGLSDPRSCALSPIQTAFLKSVRANETEKILLNFPYLSQFGESRVTPSLLSASISNTFQFFRASGKAYREAATPHWNGLVDACEELTVITLSCGLEILNSCLISGRRPALIHVVSLGPVARNRPSVPHTIIRGERDFFSRPFFRRVDHLLPGIGHLNYLESAAVAEIVNDVVNRGTTA